MGDGDTTEPLDPSERPTQPVKRFEPGGDHPTQIDETTRPIDAFYPSESESESESAPAPRRKIAPLIAGVVMAAVALLIFLLSR